MASNFPILGTRRFEEARANLLLITGDRSLNKSFDCLTRLVSPSEVILTTIDFKDLRSLVSADHRFLRQVTGVSCTWLPSCCYSCLSFAIVQAQLACSMRVNTAMGIEGEEMRCRRQEKLA